MRLPTLFQILRHLLLVLLCLSTLWLATPCMDIRDKNDTSPVCLGAKKHPKQRRQNENFSTKALADTAQTRAFLSPTVFLGTLRSVMVQRDGTVRTWFAVDRSFKSDTGTGDDKEETEVVYYRSGDGHCVLEVNQDNLKLGSQYLVFGVSSRTNSWPSMAATALPIPNDKRTLRAVKKVLCKGCAKPPGVTGLEKTRVVEGEKVRLNCHLAGNPIPWVEWYKDGVKIANKGRLRVKTKRRTSRLIIRRARLQDRGVYECRVGNIVQHEPVSVKTTLAVTRKKPTKKPPLTTSPPTSTAATTQLNPWTTEPCPTTDFCLNGGTCIFYKVVREYVCHCAEGFIGLRCDYKDVSISVGEVKKLDQNDGRLFTAILVLFLIFFCLNWACICICWLCCLRCQHNNWGKFRQKALLQKFFRNGTLSDSGKVSVDVALEPAHSPRSSIIEKWQQESNEIKNCGDDDLESSASENSSSARIRTFADSQRNSDDKIKDPGKQSKIINLT